MANISEFDKASSTFLGLAEYYSVAQDESNTDSSVFDAKTTELLEGIKSIQSQVQDVGQQIHEANIESRKHTISMLLGKVEDLMPQLEQDLIYAEKNKETIPLAMKAITQQLDGEIKLETENHALVSSLLRGVSVAISTLAMDSPALAAASINWNEILQKMEDAEKDFPLDCMRNCLHLIKSASEQEIRKISSGQK